nr:hypothetical protein [Sulfuriflexus mobilis]
MSIDDMPPQDYLDSIKKDVIQQSLKQTLYKQDRGGEKTRHHLSHPALPVEETWIGRVG